MTLHVEYGQVSDRKGGGAMTTSTSTIEPQFEPPAPVNPEKAGGFLAACFYNRKDMCFYLVSSPEFCEGCPNWRTFDKDFMERVKYRGRPPLGLFEYQRLRKPSR